MKAKRIRCDCGRVYEPEKTPACPACGTNAASAGSTQIGPPPLPPTHQPGPGVGGRTIAIIALGAIALIAITLLARRGGDQQHATVKPGPAPTTASQSPAAASAPPPATAHAGMLPQPFDLAAAIASAAPGATVKVPPGLYTGGLVASRPIRIVGTAGQVIIQSEGRECLSVRALGVAVQNVQFSCNGIGDLPAVSVADGAELELDGCRIQSGTAVGATLIGSARLNAIGTAFSAMNGVSLRVMQGMARLTQCSFVDAQVGLSSANGASVELESCAFERNGGSDAQGGIILVTGQGTVVTTSDCRFIGNYAGVLASDGGVFSAASSVFKENGTGVSAERMRGVIGARQAARITISGSTFERNAQGVAITDRSTLEMDQCAFTGNGGQQRRDFVLLTVPIAVTGEGSSAKIRNTTIADSTQFAAYAISGGALTLEDVAIIRARTAGVGVGDRSGPPARAEIRSGRFHSNGTAIGVFAGSFAKVEDSEVRDNEHGIMVGDRDSRLELRKSAVVGNREQGLTVYEEASALAVECEFRNNARGVQTGLPRKAAGRGAASLEDCTIGGNRVFGVGAHARSELILTRCTFESGNKTNVFRERTATVKTDPAAEQSTGSDASVSPTAEGDRNKPKSKRASSTPRRRPRPEEEDAARILRRLFRPR